MNKNREIETRLLSRCYSSDEKILEILSSRYSITGEQKPILTLLPTGEEQHEDKQKPSLLNLQRKKESSEQKRIANRNTRVELKHYIKSTLNKQKRLIKKIQKYNRDNRREKKSKPFPIDRLLRYYDIPVYEDFIPLNNLWQEYMQNLLFSQYASTKNIPSLSALLPKLVSADYTGCLLTVIRSVNNNLVGLRGIVVWDTQHSFIICTPRDEDSREWNKDGGEFTPSEQMGGLRVIPKKKTIFEFDVILPSGDDNGEECIGFSIIGSKFEFRSADRSNRKFKSHSVDTIL